MATGTDEKVENKVIEEIKSVEHEGVSLFKGSEGTEEEKSISEESAISAAPITDLEEKVCDKKIDPSAVIEVEKIDKAPALNIPVEESPKVVEDQDSKPDTSAVAELEIEACEKEQEEQTKVLDVPGFSIEATNKPVEHLQSPSIQESEPEVGKEPEEVSKSESNILEIEPSVEVKENPQEQSSIDEEVEENFKIHEPEGTVEDEIEGTLHEKVGECIESSKKEQTSDDQEPIASQSLDTEVSANKEAQGDSKEKGEESLIIVEKAVEDTKKEESGIDVVEGIPEEAAVEVVKVEEVKEEAIEKAEEENNIEAEEEVKEEAIEKAEKVNREKNTEVEDFTQSKTIKSENLGGSYPAAEVTGDYFEDEKEEEDMNLEKENGEKNLEVPELTQSETTKMEDVNDSNIDKVEEEKEKRNVEVEEANEEKNVEVEELTQPEVTKIENANDSVLGKIEEEKRNMKVEEMNDEKNVEVVELTHSEITRTEDVNDSNLGKVEEVNEEKNVEVEEFTLPETTKIKDANDSNLGKVEEEKRDVKVEEVNDEKNVEVEEFTHPETTKIEDANDSNLGKVEEKKTDVKVEEMNEEKNVEVEELTRSETTQAEDKNDSDMNKVEEANEKKKAKTEEVNKEKNVEVEEMIQLETTKTENVSSSVSYVGVTVDSLEGEKASRDLETVTENKKVENGKVDIQISEEAATDKNVDGKLDVVNTTTNEAIEEPKESELNAKAEETLKSAIDNSMKAEELAENIPKSDASNLGPSKDGEDSKTEKVLPKQEVLVRSTQKQLNCFISKVKQLIVKVKKAITGKSPNSKTLSSEIKEDIKVK